MKIESTKAEIKNVSPNIANAMLAVGMVDLKINVKNENNR